jgi:hypothetical protein
MSSLSVRSLAIPLGIHHPSDLLLPSELTVALETQGGQDGDNGEKKQVKFFFLVVTNTRRRQKADDCFCIFLLL